MVRIVLVEVIHTLQENLILADGDRQGTLMTYMNTLRGGTNGAFEILAYIKAIVSSHVANFTTPMTTSSVLPSS